MGKDSLAKRIARAEAEKEPVGKEEYPIEKESVLKKAAARVKKAITEEPRRKGFI